MKKITSIIFIICFLSLNLTADINKSPNDPRKYSTFTLKNGIEVVTVSDPKLATSAATLSIGVGQFQDPENAQGIAHFLEHMIFMGSEKYKSPNEYMQLSAKMEDLPMHLLLQNKQHIYFQLIAECSLKDWTG